MCAVLESPASRLRTMLNRAPCFLRGIFDSVAGLLDWILIVGPRTKAQADCKNQWDGSSSHISLSFLFAPNGVTGRIDLLG
ncbi:MAG TPA: hypothetical protein VE860_04250 [Chthoniobacterales bacterium]|nr:hypothetical protein [Chthoniobacterales bacterium]